MEKFYRVAVHYEDDNGYIEYDMETKQAKVMLSTEEKRKEVEQYLVIEHEINVPQEGLTDFHKRLVQPLHTVEDLKLALTRLWGETEVYVDWSRPVECQ